MLNSPPSQTAGGAQVGFIPLIFFDLVASGVLDTVLLPCTLYRQSEDGSLWIR
ncbi:YceK/YidQ family lipoprotein [Pseudomonas neuropathica]|uniref:YceK/YidQ family lipoprotein n=1 Tax=Pseudomonas neuropathica TaxID=2730425 RepID=UPI0034D7B3A3